MTTALFHSAWGPTALALAVGCLILVAGLVAFARPRGAWLRSRLDVYGRMEGGAAVAQPAPGWQPKTERLYGATEAALERTRIWQSTMRLLERAGSHLRPAELGYGSLLLGIGAGALAGILGASSAGILLVGVAGLAAPALWMSRKAHRRLKAFDAQLADILMTMSASLRVGQSFTHSMGAIVSEGLAPASEEFERVLQESQLGRTLDESLAAMANRIKSEDLRFVLMSVAIQREVGGSLADLFMTVSETVRERHHFRQKVSALTAMGRMSAYFLIAMPFLTAIAIELLSPGYLAPLFNTNAGHILIVVMAVMMVIGSLFLKKIVSIKG